MPRIGIVAGVLVILAFAMSLEERARRAARRAGP